MSRTVRERKVSYQLHHDQLEDKPYRIERVEVEILGEFATRDEARQYMLDTTDERKARDV